MGLNRFGRLHVYEIGGTTSRGSDRQVRRAGPPEFSSGKKNGPDEAGPKSGRKRPKSSGPRARLIDREGLAPPGPVDEDGIGGHPGRGLTPAMPLPAWHLCNTQQKSSMTRSMFTDSAFSRVAIASSRARCDMKKILAAATITLAFAPSGVLAQERVGDAALGALSGAVVLGPVGAVAGVVVGYTAGPSIAHSWGLRRSDPRHGGRSGRASGNAASNQRPPTQEAATSRPVEEDSARPAKPSTQSASVQNAMPPVQTLE